MSKAASQLRTTHTNSATSDILQYLQPSNGDRLGIVIPASLPKEQRGLGSHATARFLIPRKHLNMFDADPDRYVIHRGY